MPFGSGYLAAAVLAGADVLLGADAAGVFEEAGVEEAALVALSPEALAELSGAWDAPDVPWLGADVSSLMPLRYP